MKKEKIQDRIRTLEKERDAQMYMYAGAIQDCQHWLTQLEKKETNG